MGSQHFDVLAAGCVEFSAAPAAAHVEGHMKIVLRCQRNHRVVSEALRPEDLVVEARFFELSQRHHLVRENHLPDRLVLHGLRPCVLHVAFLVGLIALLVQAAVEIEVDLLGRERLSEQYPAFASREIGDGGENGRPEVLLAGGLVYQIEDAFHRCDPRCVDKPSYLFGAVGGTFVTAI